MTQAEIQNYDIDDVSPYDNFLFALKSSETKRQYPKLLEIFFDSISEIDKRLEMNKKADIFYQYCIRNMYQNNRA